MQLRRHGYRRSGHPLCGAATKDSAIADAPFLYPCDAEILSLCWGVHVSATDAGLTPPHELGSLQFIKGDGREGGCSEMKFVGSFAQRCRLASAAALNSGPCCSSRFVSARPSFL